MGVKALWISSSELLKALGRNHWIVRACRDKRWMVEAVDARADALVFVIMPDVVEPKAWRRQQGVPLTDRAHAHHTIQGDRVSISGHERRIKLKQALEHVALIQPLLGFPHVMCDMSQVNGWTQSDHAAQARRVLGFTQANGHVSTEGASDHAHPRKVGQFRRRERARDVLVEACMVQSLSSLLSPST